MADRVVLLAIDGLEWSRLREGVAEGRLPTVARILEHAAWAEMPVRSCVPGLTMIEHGMMSPVLWTTIATGQYYFQHGIHDFRNTIEAPEAPQLVESRHVQSPRLWDILTEYGLTSLVVGYYVTHPAYAINGVMVSDLFGEAESRHTVSPAEQAAELLPFAGEPGESAEKNAASATEPAASEDAVPAGRPPGVTPTLFKEALTRFTDLPPEEADELVGRPESDGHRRLIEYRLVYPWLRDQRFQKAFCHLVAGRKWNFATVYYRILDFVSHGFWEKSSALPDESRRVYGRTVDRAYQWIDERVAEVLSLLDPGDRVIIASDHGFTARTGSVDSHDATAVTYGEHAEPAVLLVTGGELHGRVGDVTLLDLAPTILDFFGIPQADSLDGGPVPGLLAPGPRPLPRVATYAPVGNLPSAGLTPQEEEAVLARLAALGYIEQ